MRIALLPLAAVLTGTVAGQTFVEGFDGGSNEGGWSYGVPGIVIEAAGGNPGAWLHEDLVDTFAPQARTTAASAQFHGDYRAQNVISISADFITNSTQFPFLREATLMLTNFNGTPGTADDDVVYFLGTEFVPQVVEGWKTITWSVPAYELGLPAGWSVLQGSGSVDEVWRSVVCNVDEVRFFYGDPTLFFIFDQWDVGLDNVSITRADLGGVIYCTGKTNSQGCAPKSGISGTPSETDPNPFLVGAWDTLNNKNGIVFYGFAPAALPFQNGTLCVQPPLRRTVPQGSGGNPPPNDCSGGYALDFNALIQGGAPGLTAGAQVFCQHWMRDPLVDPTGIVLSDGATFVIQP